MLYGLKFVPHHPVYRLHAVFGNFLEKGLKADKFGPHCFQEWFRPVLSASSGLRERCKAVFLALQQHRNDDVRNSIVNVWKSQNEVQTLCQQTTHKLSAWEFHDPILVKAIIDLFDFLYEETLQSKSFGRAVGNTLLDHYNSFRGLGQRVCPFCGLNYYADCDGGLRSSYDHFLPRLHYPLGAVNFRNLVPMCKDCNEPPRKGTKDVIFQEVDRVKRRRFYYPYSTPGGVVLSLKCLRPPSLTHMSGSWKVNAKACKPIEEVLVKAWNSVFDIETRFSARVKEGFDGWMKDFLSTKGYNKTPTITRLRRDIAAKAAWLSKPEQLRNKAEAALQAAVFSYMAEEAPDDMLAGYAATATSPAVVGISDTLNRN